MSERSDDSGARDSTGSRSGARARETCPVFPGRTKLLHAGFDDSPALAREARGDDEALAIYRRVRDEIRAFIETLPGGLEERASTAV